MMMSSKGIRTAIFLLILGMCLGANAQYSPYVDSLTSIVKESKNPATRLSAYYNLIENLYWKGDTTNGDRFAEEFIVFGETHFPVGAKGVLDVLESQRIFAIHGDIQASLRVCLRGIDQLKKTENGQDVFVEFIAAGYNQMGYLYQVAGAYDRSLEYYQLAENAVENANLIDLQVSIFNNLAILLDEYFKDKAGGLVYLNKALVLAEEMGDKETTGMITSNLGAYYNSTGDYEKAKAYLESAIVLQETAKDSLGLASSLLELARVGYYQKEISIEQADAPRIIALVGEYCYWCYYIYLTMGDISIAENNPDYGRKMFQKAIVAAKRYGNLDGQYTALRSLAGLENAAGNWKRAAEYFEQSVNLKDSIDGQWKIAKVTELKTRKELRGIEQEKLLLNVENEKLEIRVGAQSLRFKITLIFLAIFLVAGAIIIRKQLQLRKSYTLLVRKNRELASRPLLNIPLIQPQRTEEKANFPDILPDHLPASPLALTETELELIQMLEHQLEDKEIFTDHELTLHALAQHLDTNTTYLSKVINNAYGKSFRTVVNDYRINKVLKSFEQEEQKAITIHAIAQQAGFKSKSSFNAAFKRYTGVTPTFYIANMGV